MCTVFRPIYNHVTIIVYDCIVWHNKMNALFTLERHAFEIYRPNGC